MIRIKLKEEQTADIKISGNKKSKIEEATQKWWGNTSKFKIQKLEIGNKRKSSWNHSESTRFHFTNQKSENKKIKKQNIMKW